MEKKIQRNNITIFCSNIDDGNMSQKYGDINTVEKNKQLFFNSIGIDIKKCYRLDITYKDIIKNLNSKSNVKTIKADAVIITEPQKFIYLAFADCIPFVLFDNSRNVLAFAHLGWQSICENLHIKTISRLATDYKCDLKDIHVFFGPSIQAKSYIFPNPAQLSMKGWEKYVIQEDTGYSVDLIGYIVNDIISYGIKQNNIELSDIDTAQNNKYFSHYRSVHQNELEGRFIFGVGITK